MIRPYQPADQEQVEQCIIALQDFERALRINVLARNSGAWALYSKVGFRDYEIRLLKDLGQRPEPPDSSAG